MNASKSLMVALAATSAIFSTACSSPAQRPQPAPPPAVTAATSFAELQSIFFAKFPRASRLVASDGFLPLTAQEFNDTADSNAAVLHDFERWCALKAGVLYREVERTSVPAEYRDAVKAAEAMFTVTARQYISVVFKQVCAVQGRPYILFSARASLSASPDARYSRAVAWMTPESLGLYGPQAFQALEAERQKAREQQAADKREAEAAQAKADAQRTALLDASAKGRVLRCDGHQSQGQGVATMMFMCNGLGVFYGDFAPHGWRVLTETTTPKFMNGVPQGSQVEIVLQKVR